MIRPDKLRAYVSRRDAEPTPGTADHIGWMGQMETLYGDLDDDERDLMATLEADNGRRLDNAMLDLLFAAPLQ